MPLFTQTTLLAEITEAEVHLLHGNQLHASKLDRLPNGHLTPACLQRLQTELKSFLQPKQWLPPQPVTCALHARGISLRHITLPPTNPEQQPQLLRLQIENTFPLPPQQLAWGALLPKKQNHNLPTNPPHPIPVFALRRESLNDYETLFTSCHCTPTFTLANLARTQLCKPNPNRWSLLHLNPEDAELITLDNHIPTTLQLLPWGHNTLLNHPGKPPLPDLSAIGPALVLSCNPRDIHNPEPVLQALQPHLSPHTQITHIPLTPTNANPTALQALQTQLHSNSTPALTLQNQTSTPRPLTPTPNHYKWAIASAILLVSLILLHLLHSSRQQSRLTQAMNQVRQVRQSLPLVDQQLGFLSYLQTNRQPYLRILATIAQSATPGLQIESLSLNRRGDLLLRGMLQGQQPPTDFRTKLVESGAFTSVVLEEQTPGQNESISFRIAAHWDSAQVRSLPDLPPAPPLPSIPGMPPGMIPGSMPPGMPMPMPPNAMIQLQ